MKIGDRILAAFNRFLIRMMEDHNNSIQLPDGTVLTRHTAEYAAWVRTEGWRLYQTERGSFKHSA